MNTPKHISMMTVFLLVGKFPKPSNSKTAGELALLCPAKGDVSQFEAQTEREGHAACRMSISSPCEVVCLAACPKQKPRKGFTGTTGGPSPKIAPKRRGIPTSLLGKPKIRRPTVLQLVLNRRLPAARCGLAVQKSPHMVMGFD